MPIKYENNIAMYERVAKTLGLKCEHVYSTYKKKPLLISNDKKFFLISTGSPGFYPSVKRFNAHLTTNKMLSQQVLQKFNYRVIGTTPVQVQDYSSSDKMLQTLIQQPLLFPLLINFQISVRLFLSINMTFSSSRLSQKMNIESL